MNTETLKQFSVEFFKLVAQSEKILITSHISPDDDSIASVLSIAEIISQKYPDKSFRIVYTGKPVTRWHTFKRFSMIEFVDDVSNELNGVDFLIMLDGSEYFRFSHNSEVLKTVPKTICIDHHASPPATFTLSLIDTSMPANAELIYRTFEHDMVLNKELAEIFLLGIFGDTGNFAFLKPHQSETLSIAKKLVDCSGVFVDEFQSRYNTISQREFEVIQEFIKNTNYIELPNWPGCQYSCIDRAVVKERGYTDEEISAGSSIYMSHYLRLITGYTWGFTLKPRSNGDCHLSFRSLSGSVKVRDMVERMQIGGGHDRACGGAFKKVDHDIEMSEGVEKIKTWMSENIPVVG
jgi:bifunctional oligoribonuclease and PAP phosphatase NrnA